MPRTTRRFSPQNLRPTPPSQLIIRSHPANGFKLTASKLTGSKLTGFQLTGSKLTAF